MKTKTLIKNYIRLKKIPPYRLAKMAKVSKSSLYYFLRGDSGLALSTAEKLMAFIKRNP